MKAWSLPSTMWATGEVTKPARLHDERATIEAKIARIERTIATLPALRLRLEQIDAELASFDKYLIKKGE